MPAYTTRLPSRRVSYDCWFNRSLTTRSASASVKSAAAASARDDQEVTEAAARPTTAATMVMRIAAPVYVRRQSKLSELKELEARGRPPRAPPLFSPYRAAPMPQRFQAHLHHRAVTRVPRHPRRIPFGAGSGRCQSTDSPPRQSNLKIGSFGERARARIPPSGESGELRDHARAAEKMTRGAP